MLNSLDIKTGDYLQIEQSLSDLSIAIRFYGDVITVWDDKVIPLDDDNRHYLGERIFKLSIYAKELEERMTELRAERGDT